MSIGPWQILIVLLIILIIFGAGKLPKVMGDLAKGVKNFKSGLKEDETDTDEREPRPIESRVASASGAADAEKDKAARG